MKRRVLKWYLCRDGKSIMIYLSGVGPKVYGLEIARLILKTGYVIY